MITTLAATSMLGESRLSQIRDLLKNPEIALPFFGRAANSEMVDRFLKTLLHSSPHARVEVMLAIDSTSAVLGVASVRGGTLSFFVDPAHWGQGIARTMVSAMCARSRENGEETTLTAMIYRENTRSQKVVEAAGFSFAGLRESGVSSYAGRPLLRYMRRLGRSTPQS